MEAYYWGSGCVDPPFLILGSRWRLVVIFTSLTLYPFGESPPVSIGWTPEPVWTVWRSIFEISLLTVLHIDLDVHLLANVIMLRVIVMYTKTTGTYSLDLPPSPHVPLGFTFSHASLYSSVYCENY
jgi:hypothetical protein